MPSLGLFVDQLDSFGEGGDLYTFASHQGVPIGYILPFVAAEFEAFADVVEVDHTNRTVTISPTLYEFEARNTAFMNIANEWRKNERFDTLKGWRNELYTVYNPTSKPYLLIERALSGLLGVITYGVHINGYVPPEESEDGQLKLWIPRRSYEKPTCPGQLDNTVAGGLGYPYGAYETCLKECYEEAGLPEEYTKTNLKPCGVATYIYQKNLDLSREEAMVQPEVEFVYDLKFDAKTIPTPVDGEVHEFYLISVEEVLEKLHAGEFKYNCAGITIDFLIRHGYITHESEPDYLKLQQKLHRVLPFPTI